MSHAAEICSPRTRAITPQETAPTSATAAQITMLRVRDLVLTAFSSLERPLGRTDPRARGRSNRSAEQHDLPAGVAHGADDRVRMVLSARLDHELDGGLAHVQVEPLADVRDVDDVRALGGDAVEQPREVA